MKKMIYLDAVNGDDHNPGTQDKPVKTMRAAKNRGLAKKIPDIMIVNSTDELRAEAKALNEEAQFVAKAKTSNGKLFS